MSAMGLEQALSQPDPVTAALNLPYEEDDVRTFLGILLAELDKLKPWDLGQASMGREQ